MKIKQIAKVCHEANRAYCESIGDDSQPRWEDAPEWQKESAINGVEFHITNDTTPEQSHENWMKDKLEAGWKYGKVKDPEKKEHPCLVPYDELPQEQRSKDFIFKSICESIPHYHEGLSLYYIGLPDRKDNRQLIAAIHEQHARERAEREFGYQALPVEVEPFEEVEGYPIFVGEPDADDTDNESPEKEVIIKLDEMDLDLDGLITLFENQDNELQEDFQTYLLGNTKVKEPLEGESDGPVDGGSEPDKEPAPDEENTKEASDKDKDDQDGDEEKDHKCPECGKSFKTERGLQIHIGQVHE